MQLSDLIKSKIDLYGLSFGIGSRKVRMVAHKRSARLTETKGSVSRKSHAMTNERTKSSKKKTTTKPRNLTNVSNKTKKKKSNPMKRQNKPQSNHKKAKGKQISNGSIKNRSIKRVGKVRLTKQASRRGKSQKLTKFGKSNKKLVSKVTKKQKEV